MLINGAPEHATASFVPPPFETIFANHVSVVGIRPALRADGYWWYLLPHHSLTCLSALAAPV